MLAVVGDVSCEPGETEPAGEKAGESCLNPKAPYTSTSLWQSQEATANQIETMKPDLVAIARRSAIPGRPIFGLRELVRFDLWRFQNDHAARAWQPRVL